ncbi:hypothetical protein E8E13_010864 [Curvularia kusanoi]|uniref:Uncharacterized protein n=1 Tax=Curvularia kusanoi TaxID=90978 RepID=A0A9P4TNZ3_CURKU|nr:hypothetical protein E8E13_010864 [Curvularia kusanoi]
MAQVSEAASVYTTSPSIHAMADPTALPTVSFKEDTSTTATSLMSLNDLVHNTWKDYIKPRSEPTTTTSAPTKTTTSTDDGAITTKKLIGNFKSTKIGLTAQMPVMADGSVRGQQCAVM